MAVLLYPRIPATLPTSGAVLREPYDRNLLAAFAFGAGAGFTDLVSGLRLNPGSHVLGTAGGTAGLICGAGTPATIAPCPARFKPTLSATSGVTMIARMSFFGTAPANAVIADITANTGGGVSPYIAYGLGTDASGLLRVCCSNGGAFVQQNGGASYWRAPVIGQPFTMAGLFTAGELTIYFGPDIGIVLATTVNPSYSGTSELRIGASTPNMCLEYVLFYNRRLIPSELKLFRDNPYHWLRPAAGRQFALGAAAPPLTGPPVYEVGIGEAVVVPLLATFRIQETIDAPDTMIADVFSLAAPPPLPAYQARILADGATAYWPLDDPAGSTTARDLVGADDPVPFLRFALGLPVYVTENGVRIFGGVVTGTRERGLTGPSATDLVVEIQATSYELSAARRVITAAISQDGAETIGAAFATLVTDYYAEVDVTLHPDQVAGPALPAATFTRARGDAVNKHLAASVGYLQSIDFENRLRAWAPGDVLAPANYDEAVNPELLTGDITVERQLQNGYANRVILTGDPIPVPGHVDHFTGDGTTNVWPVTYVVNGPYPYFVDGAVAQGVIQYPATSTTESIGGVEAPPGFLWEYDPIAHTIHRRGGPVAAGVAFDFPYDGLFIPAGTAEDAGEIAAYGLWEHVENVTAVITDISAQGYADALLAAKIASKDEIVRIQTRALGFHPGQTMTIASFSRLLAGDYLITQVDTGSESGGILLVRSITASKSQNNTHDWRRVYQQWAGASAQTEST